MRLECVFCQRPFEAPHRRASREHAYPHWLAAYWPNPKPRVYTNFRTGSHRDAANTSLSHREMPITAWDQKVKVVCEPCNNGWMNRELEVPAQALFPRLFAGPSQRLTLGERQRTAAWAWKTASMVSYLADAGSRGIARKEYREFFERRRPPYRSGVWMGHYARGGFYDEWWGPWTTTIGAPGDLAVPPQPNAYSIPFTVGNLFFLVFGTSSRDMRPLAPRGTLRRAVAQLWPTAPGAERTPDGLVTAAMLRQLEADFVGLGPGGGLRRGRSGLLYGFEG